MSQENPRIKTLRNLFKRQGYSCSHCNFCMLPSDIIELHHQLDFEGKRTGTITFVQVIATTKYTLNPKVRHFSHIRVLFSRSRISGDAYVRFWSRGDYGNVIFDCNIIASWSCKRLHGFVCSTRKAVHDLSLERRETVWFLSTASVKN
ncbi:hypothetical protein MHU86_9602 (mitochondrion) [Fragilaria crotonensis]|nr:hypothetical protein MHU86_9602 [Fragilaria crotonensis]